MADGACAPHSLTKGPIDTTCPYCGVGCGISASIQLDGALNVTGATLHPANHGLLCSKGAALGSTIGKRTRLLHPEVMGVQVGWEEAIDDVASRLRSTIDQYGPESVAFYVSGQLLTEDYYAANKLMKGYIGTANIDTNSRLCMASAVIAHKQAFGADIVPGCYEDLEIAELIVFSGHNAAFTHPVLMRRMETAKASGQKWVVIDPRRTQTAEGAELHLPIAPQTDVRLWNGLLAWLVEHGACDKNYIRNYVSGFEKALTALSRDDQSTQAIAKDCGLDIHAVEAFYALFTSTPKTVSLFSQGSNQSAQGVAKGLAVINAHLATGRIGKPGACPFSITGQPNAMGGRETGGMATTLAAHMDFHAASRKRVQRFWNSPSIAARPGLKAVEMFDAVHDGRIKAIWIIATNPAVSMPNSNKVRDALERCPNVIASDCIAQSDTLDYAHVKLPALAWSEKDGTVTNSERCISRQRALFSAAGEARADWRIIADVAKAMGYSNGFDWRSAADVFREYAALTRFENHGERLLDLGPLSVVTDADYSNMSPMQWPINAGGGKKRLFEDGLFPTADGRARLNVPNAKGPGSRTTKQYPFSLNTGRIRDQWHTMTRTGLAAELCRHEPEPFVEIHPDDAIANGIQDRRLARISTPFGEAVILAKITPCQRPGSLFMPMHWTRIFAAKGLCNSLVNPIVDSQSGQPEFKHTPASIMPYLESWRGFFISRESCPAPLGADIIWRQIPIDEGFLYEFAGHGGEDEINHVRLSLTGNSGGDVISFTDQARGSQRWASCVREKLDRILMISTSGSLPDRNWLSTLFAQSTLKAEDRVALLTGSPANGATTGPIVCACLNVGENIIQNAISVGAQDIDAIGAATKAGTNCGSCRIELKRMLVAAGQSNASRAVPPTHNNAVKEPRHAA